MSQSPYSHTCVEHPRLACPACRWVEEHQPDVIVSNEGTVVLFRPMTKRARAWVDGNVQAEPWQWFGDALVVEHRYAADLAQGMRDDGLLLR